MVDYFTQSRKEAKYTKSSVYIRNVWRLQGRTRGAIGSARHVERQRNISFFEAFSLKRSFAYAQDDAPYFLCSDDKESNHKTLRVSNTQAQVRRPAPVIIFNHYPDIKSQS